MNQLKFLWGLCLACVLIVTPWSQWQPPQQSSVHTLAVQLEGRKKPLDTVARETVATIHGAARYQLDNGQVLDAQQTYWSLWLNSRDWNDQPFILVNYRPLKAQLGLPLEQKHFSFSTLINSDLGEVIERAQTKQRQDQVLTRDEREALILEDRLTLMLTTVGRQSLPIVPHPSDLKGTWVGIPEVEQLYSSAQVEMIQLQFERLQQHHRVSGDDINALTDVVAPLQQSLASLSPEIYPASASLQREVFFNQFHPFAKAWKLYAIAFLTLLISQLISPIDLYWSGMGIFLGGILVQAFGFGLRMQIAGRPPVTNMYESVVWVGFGIAALAFSFELQTKARFYLLAAAPLTVLCLLLADSLPAVLDPSIGPLVPVLRDNFWLSVHVPTITLSYASFALAMGLGHFTLVQYWLQPDGSPTAKTLAQLNTRVIQVGILLLTTGIILGGIWAHFSWGRFWGWDPKETWALIALLCYLAPVHGRLAGWLGNFGMSVASVLSFNAVLMAWYGVNFVLGTGLHSYGFSTGGSELLIGSIVGLDTLFVLATMLHYRSQRQPPMPKLGSDTQPIDA
mgnify:CR=1 FL=1